MVVLLVLSAEQGLDSGTTQVLLSLTASAAPRGTRHSLPPGFDELRVLCAVVSSQGCFSLPTCLAMVLQSKLDRQ